MLRVLVVVCGSMLISCSPWYSGPVEAPPPPPPPSPESGGSSGSSEQGGARAGRSGDEPGEGARRAERGRESGRVGTVYFWMNVGAANGKPLCLPPALVSKGWASYARSHVAEVQQFGAPGGVIVSNPCGQPTKLQRDGRHLAYKSMSFYQRKMAEEAGMRNVSSDAQLYEAMMTLRGATPGDVWVYLGTPRDEVLTDAEIWDAVEPFARAGCGIVLDAAGVEFEDGHPERAKRGWKGRPAWEVAQVLDRRGVRLGYEPRPVRGTPWAETGWMCFGLTREKLDEQGNRVDNGFLRTDPEKYRSRTEKNRDDELGGAILLVSGSSSTDFVIDLLSRGYDVAISGYKMNERKTTAAQLIERARARASR